MKLLFEKSVQGRKLGLLPVCDLPKVELDDCYVRNQAPRLPELSESDLSRHYSELERRTHGVNNGFYPLGSCTMKYNPAVNEQVARLAGFADIHPLQSADTVPGALEALRLAETMLAEVSGMDAVTLQPAAGAHGEFTGLLLIKKHHESRGDTGRNVILVPDSAHGTNPATAAMCGMRVAHIPSGADGCVDIGKLRAAVGADTAGIMLTNPNTLGIFEKDIAEILEIIHAAGALAYCDGANLNAIMGIARPGDMGFDCIHMNLHKTFSTPHGGGGPGVGAVACKAFLGEFLQDTRVKAFHGNFLVVIRALAYMLTLGADGLRAASETAVLNANYFKKLLAERYTVPHGENCLHEFVISMEKEAAQGVTALDIAKLLIDRGIHPPTIYFPLIVREALMVEPTETESRETLDEAARVFIEIYDAAMADPVLGKVAPQNAAIRRPDEVAAARSPVVRYTW
ncbi:MAG: aminomethyl-transferring glycine dehydrogenase subunit GcvPB [Clostridiales bacterium]|nr:aminomethyl-transferring glycine dehydrogenase subunit GcvPB [Clostridiales bacterium]